MTKSRKVQTGKHGARFVLRTSRKTGKRYKQYLSRRTRVIRSPLKATKGMVFIPFR
jgi:hypothetical protein